jgi:hypothetical protein
MTGAAARRKRLNVNALPHGTLQKEVLVYLLG